MSANPITDQILAAADKTAAGTPARAPFVNGLAEFLHERLPDVDEQLLGEIVMHAGNAAATVTRDLNERHGWSTGRASMYAIVTLGEAGAVLYRGRGDAGTTP